MLFRRLATGLMAAVMLTAAAVPAAAETAAPVQDTSVEEAAIGLSEENIFTKLYGMTSVGKILMASGTGAKFSVNQVMLSDFNVKPGQLKGFYLETTIPSQPSDTDVTVNIGGDYNLYKESGGSRMGVFARGGAEIPGDKKMYGLDVDISENDVIAFNFNVEYRNMKTSKGQTDISGAAVKVSDQVFTGKALTPAVTVTLDGKQLSGSSDYTTKYVSNTEPGVATVIVTGKGNYKGTATASFKIKPKKVGIRTAKSPKKKTVKVTWKKDSHCTGYQILLSTSKKFKAGRKSVFVKRNTAGARTIKGLKSKKRYYIKIRAYKAVGNKKVYGRFSKTLTVKVK